MLGIEVEEEIDESPRGFGEGEALERSVDRAPLSSQRSGAYSSERTMRREVDMSVGGA